MAFTADYIHLCYRARSIYEGKPRKYGDWFGNSVTLRLKLFDPESKTDFNTPEWFYIPDLDDLLELMTNQIRACQKNEFPAKSIEFVFDPAENWRCVVKLDNGTIIRSFRQISLHEAILRAIFQMVPHPSEKNKLCG